MALVISSAQDEQGVVVDVAGEVDVSNAPELREAVDAALAQAAEAGVGRVEVSLAEVPYIDSTGIGVLVGAAHRAAEQGLTLGVAAPQRNVARVLALLGLSAELGVHDVQE